MRVVKAFAQEERRYANFERSASRVFSQQMVSTRIAGVLQPAHRLPAADRPRRSCSSSAGDRSSPGTRRWATSRPSTRTCSRCWGRCARLGISLGLAQRATASGARLFQILDREPELVAPAGAQPLPPGAGDVRLDHVSLRYEGAHRRGAARRHAARRRRARPSRWSAARARARRRSSPCSRGCTTRPRARCASTAPTSATSTCGRCAARSRSSTTTRSCSRRACATTSPTRGPTPPTRRSSRPPAARRRTSSSSGCPTATRRASASAG